MNNKKNKNKNQIMKELFNEDLEYIDKEEINKKSSIHSSKSRSMQNIFDNNKNKKNIINKENDNEEKKHNEDFDFITNLPNKNNNNEEIYDDFIEDNNNENVNEK